MNGVPNPYAQEMNNPYAQPMGNQAPVNPYQSLQGQQAMPMQGQMAGAPMQGNNQLLMAQMLRNAERSGGGANNMRGLYDRVSSMMPATAVNREEIGGFDNPMNNQAQIQKLQEQGLV